MFSVPFHHIMSLQMLHHGPLKPLKKTHTRNRHLNTMETYYVITVITKGLFCVSAGMVLMGSSHTKGKTRWSTSSALPNLEDVLIWWIYTVPIRSKQQHQSCTCSCWSSAKKNSCFGQCSAWLQLFYQTQQPLRAIDEGTFFSFLFVNN